VSVGNGRAEEINPPRPVPTKRGPSVGQLLLESGMTTGQLAIVVAAVVPAVVAIITIWINARTQAGINRQTLESQQPTEETAQRASLQSLGGDR
jgi:hypothetical protein